MSNNSIRNIGQPREIKSGWRRLLIMLFALAVLALGILQILQFFPNFQMLSIASTLQDMSSAGLYLLFSMITTGVFAFVNTEGKNWMEKVSTLISFKESVISSVNFFLFSLISFVFMFIDVLPATYTSLVVGIAMAVVGVCSVVVVVKESCQHCWGEQDTFVDTSSVLKRVPSPRLSFCHVSGISAEEAKRLRTERDELVANHLGRASPGFFSDSQTNVQRDQSEKMPSSNPCNEMD
jgi:hypothetical protein